MKRIIIILILSVFISSCEDLLDKEPQTTLSEKLFWQTEKDLNAAVNGLYNCLHSDNPGTSGVSAFDQFGMLDVMTEIAASRAAAPFAAVANGSFGSGHKIIATRWTECYRAVVRANDIMAHIDAMNVDEDLRSVLKGETLFLRAWFYFNLVYFFGDVPLILDVPTLENAYVSRNPKDEVIDQMHQDLDDALALLPTSPRETGRVAKGAALTLKAKIHMQELEYAEAIPVLEEIIGLGYSLYDNYRTLFLVEGENNSEVIFNAEYTSGTGKKQGNSFNTLYGNKSMLGTGWSWFLPTKELIEMYETKEDGLPDPKPLYDRKDPRMDMTVMRPGSTFLDKNDVVKKYPEQVQNYSHTETGFHCRKFVIEGSSPDAPFTGLWDSPQNWIFFRYADVLLLYAEAVNEVEGPQAEVYDAVNQIRSRPGVQMPPVETGKSKDELREIIRHERAVELALEGWRYFDLKRWGLLQEVNDGFKVINIRNGKTVVTRIFEEHNNLWPIPLTELDRNPNLRPQNPGY